MSGKRRHKSYAKATPCPFKKTLYENKKFKKQLNNKEPKLSMGEIWERCTRNDWQSRQKFWKEFDEDPIRIKNIELFEEYFAQQYKLYLEKNKDSESIKN